MFSYWHEPVSKASDTITEDGFKYSYGRFTTVQPSNVERIDGTRLRELFLPVVTSEAKRLMQRDRDFVVGQLKHYDISYEPKEYTGNGANLLKKLLKEGKFDKLPKRIKTLEAELRDRWLNALSPDELSGQPDWVMDKYFLNPSGKPDRAKTTDVIEIPFPESSSYRVGQLKEAAIRVGVHHATAYGPSTQVVLLGWDQSAVQKAAKQYAIDAKAKHEDEIDRREAARVAKHDQYRARTKKGDATIVGKYIIDCEGISGNWDGCDNLTMSIKATKTPGLYQADFDFGMLEGVMMMSDNESALGVFGCYDSSDEDQGPTMVGFKRKSGSNHGTTTKKIAKATNSTAGGKSKTFFLRMRSAETGEGEINPDPTEGSITVSDDYASFTGSAEMPIVGCNIPFTGRKISDVPEKSRKRWDDYSHAAYEYASSARWQ